MDFCNRLDYDFSELEKSKNNVFYEFGALEAAMRQLAMKWEIRDYLKTHPNASVVNLGCGLDQTGKSIENGTCKIYNIDFPDIIEIRNKFLKAGERELDISGDLKDKTWMDKIDGENGVIFFSAGVFHYFQIQEVKDLILEMARRFPKSRLIFDTVGKFGLNLMKRTLKNMGIDDVKGLFYVDNIETLEDWSSGIKVSERGYMLGYYDLKEYNIPWVYRFLGKIGDEIFGMKIIRMEFSKA